MVYKSEKVIQAKTIVTHFARATVTKSFQMTSGNTSITSLRNASQPDLDY